MRNRITSKSHKENLGVKMMQNDGRVPITASAPYRIQHSNKGSCEPQPPTSNGRLGQKKRWGGV
jgi:hypothetical protein